MIWANWLLDLITIGNNFFPEKALQTCYLLVQMAIYCTLTGHFIRYTLLVPGWTPFYLQNYLNSNKVLELIVMFKKQVW